MFTRQSRETISVQQLSIFLFPQVFSWPVHHRRSPILVYVRYETIIHLLNMTSEKLMLLS